MFEFSYYWPVLDWYEERKVILHKNEYDSYCLERRYDKRWWLIGKKFNHEEYTWERKDIGPIGNKKLKEFIKWSTGGQGNQITEIRSISKELNLLKHINDLITLINT